MMKSSLRRNTRVFRGQAYVEYALILALASIGLLWAVNQATDTIGESGEQIACDIAYNGRVDCSSDGIGGGGGNGLPVARFVYSCTDMVCSFDGTSSFDSNGEIVGLEWDFGAEDATGSGWVPDHTYGAEGSYKVTLTVIDNDGNTDDTTKTVVLGDMRPQECPPTMHMGLDNLPAGTIITDQFPGVTISSEWPDRHPIMIFDTANPTGDDDDLGAPNADFGGPGHGSGGAAGKEGENSEPLGKVMIISGNGSTDNPDDKWNGGWFYFDFEYDATVGAINFLDVDGNWNAPSVHLYDRDGTKIFEQVTRGLGDNSFQTMEINQTSVARMVVEYPGSGAIDAIFFCDDPVVVGLGDAEDTNNEVVEDNDVSENQPPAASFTYSCNNMECSFDGTGSNDPDGTIEAVLWDFGDGMAGNAQSVTHTYEAGGTYDVKLTVTDNDGASQDVTLSVEVTGSAGDETAAETCDGSPTVSSISVYEKGLGRHIMDLSEGAILDLSDHGVRINNITLVGNITNGNPTSVQFTINGSKYRVEHRAPYVIDGDNNRWNGASLGDHLIRVSAHSARNGRGEEYSCLAFNITIRE